MSTKMVNYWMLFVPTATMRNGAHISLFFFLFFSTHLATQALQRRWFIALLRQESFLEYLSKQSLCNSTNAVSLQQNFFLLFMRRKPSSSYANFFFSRAHKFDIADISCTFLGGSDLSWNPKYYRDNFCCKWGFVRIQLPVHLSETYII